MAINWYPIIDYEKCTACLACIEFCPHNVFIEANGKTLVANPDNCIEFCRGCQKGACEDDAIMFFGDSRISEAEIKCSCSGDSETYSQKEV